MIDLSDQQASFIAIYVSIVFAFIAASYVVGSKLNKVQTTVATLLFSVTCIWLVHRITMIGFGLNFMQSLLQDSALSRLNEGLTPEHTVSVLQVALTGSIWSLGMCGALIFLWDIRHRDID
ncbi:hypothetical protein DWB85_15410 [Seongchinamella sediminis]|uniref:Uncharacterized protein n=1 Tax=Seongchinamella sediminis TaxID=2283635 RepID=A0A3L7DT49_9GAMM|nr:hypothetical protein DWB85_15410 [Seongchinamella sediminis]